MKQPADSKIATANLIAKALKVQPKYIVEMIEGMGDYRSELFKVAILRGGKEFLDLGVKTFFTYQTYVKNKHPKNINWWSDKLIGCGYEPNLSMRDIEGISVYLHDLDVTPFELHSFIESSVKELNRTQEFDSMDTKPIKFSEREWLTIDIQRQALWLQLGCGPKSTY